MRGNIGDRPWGATLSAIGLGGLTGQLTLTAADHKQYKIAFANGVVIAAQSPISVDSLARIALSMKLLPAAIAKQLGKVEDIEKFAAAAALGPTQIQALKRRVIVQRAARTFAVDVGTYVVDERILMPVMLGIEVDIRAAIYEGIRLNLSQQRMVKTMHGLGSRFVLREDQAEDLAKFGFTDLEEPVLAALREGTSVPELEATRRDIDPRMAEAVILALALTDTLQEITMTRVPTPREPTVSRVPTPREPTSSMSAVPMLIHQDPAVPRSPTPRAFPRAGTQGRIPTPREEMSRIAAPAISRTATQAAVAEIDRTPPTQPALNLTPPTLPQVPLALPLPPPPPAPVRRTSPPPVPPPRRTQDATSRAVQIPDRPVTHHVPAGLRRPAHNLTSGEVPTLGRDARRAALDPSAPPHPPTRRAAVTDPFLEIQATRQRPNQLSVAEVAKVIEIGVELLGRGVDHFTFLGLPFGAPIEAVREAYIEFARYLRPERLASLGIPDDDHDAHTVFAQVVIAYTVLSDPRRRAEYMAQLQSAHA